MKKRLLILKVYLMLALFAPLALIPPSGHSALLSSRGVKGAPAAGRESAAFLRPAVPYSLLVSRGDRRFLTPREARLISGGRCPIYIGGTDDDYSPLSTNETVAIVLTVIILGIMVGFVSQDH
jgi:hypothetical protein